MHTATGLLRLIRLPRLTSYIAVADRKLGFPGPALKLSREASGELTGSENTAREEGEV